MDKKTEEFLSKLKEKGYLYDDVDYSKVKYVNYSTKVILIQKGKEYDTEHAISPSKLLNNTTKLSFSNCLNKKSFEEAREYAQSLGLKSQKEWKEHTKSDGFPSDIPKYPYSAYRMSGEWTNWGDFFGTGNQKGGWKPFNESREYARSLGLKSKVEWEEHIKSAYLPSDIPKKPNTVYGKIGEWTNWGDFLGTGTVANQNKEYRSFEDTREYVRSLRLKSVEEWFGYTKRDDFPSDIPKQPYHVYGKIGEWNGWTDFLGTGEQKDG